MSKAKQKQRPQACCGSKLHHTHESLQCLLAPNDPFKCWSRGQTLQLAKRIPSVVYPASLVQKIWCHAWWYASKRCGAKRCGASCWHCYWQGLVVLVHADIWYLTTAAAKQDRGALSTFAVDCKLMLLLLVVLFPVEFSGGELASQVLSVILR